MKRLARFLTCAGGFDSTKEKEATKPEEPRKAADAEMPIAPVEEKLTSADLTPITPNLIKPTNNLTDPEHVELDTAEDEIVLVTQPVEVIDEPKLELIEPFEIIEKAPTVESSPVAVEYEAAHYESVEPELAPSTSVVPETSLSGPLQMESAESVEPQQVQSKQVEPELAQSTLVESELVPSSPVESELVQSTPVDSELVQSTIVESELVQSTPVELELVQSTPVELELVQSTPVELELVQSTPVEPELVQTTPVEPELAQSTLVESELVQTTPVELELSKSETSFAEPLIVEPAHSKPVESELAQSESSQSEPEWQQCQSETDQSKESPSVPQEYSVEVQLGREEFELDASPLLSNQDEQDNSLLELEDVENEHEDLNVGIEEHIITDENLPERLMELTEEADSASEKLHSLQESAENAVQKTAAEIEALRAEILRNILLARQLEETPIGEINGDVNKQENNRKQEKQEMAPVAAVPAKEKKQRKKKVKTQKEGKQEKNKIDYSFLPAGLQKATPICTCGIAAIRKPQRARGKNGSSSKSIYTCGRKNQQPCDYKLVQ